MDEERLAAIESRCNAATPGPWYPVDVTAGDEQPVWGVGGPAFREGAEGMWYGEDDACFVATARQDIPDLLAEVRRLREALRQIEQTAAEWDRNRLGGLDIQRKRWQRLGALARQTAGKAPDPA